MTCIYNPGPEYQLGSPFGPRIPSPENGSEDRLGIDYKSAPGTSLAGTPARAVEAGVVWYSTLKMRSTIVCVLFFICSAHGFLLSEVHATENEAKLQQFSQYVKRSGKTLTLSLANGKTLTFVNKLDPNGTEGVKYEFEDYVQSINYFLVSTSVNEGGAYHLINRHDGSKFSIDERPVFSPAYDRLITVSICDAYCPYRLQIWKINPKPSVEWTFKPQQYWASGSAKWLDGKTIEVTSQIADPAASDPGKGKYIWKKEMLQLKLLPGGWAFAK